MNARHGPDRQRGAAALVVTALLFFAMLLVVAAAHRNVLTETRSSANQYRSTQAFEAAEAGLEWALARLNDDTRLGDDCLPGDADGAASFRDRHLHYDATLGALAPTLWNDGGTPTALLAACLRGDTGWSCSCPAAGAPSLAAIAGTSVAPAFAVELLPGAKPGLVVAVATGCTTRTTPCGATADAAQEAAVRVEVAFGLVPGLRAAPVAALTTGGDVDAGDASLGLHGSDGEAGGVAVDAGGHVAGTALRLFASAGSTPGGSIVAADASLAGVDGDRFFRRWFGMGKAAWIAQPAVTRITCSDACGSAVATAVARGSRLISVEGDLALDGPATFGTPDQPIVVVASGSLRLHGGVTVNGLVYAAAIDWREATGGATIDGAAIAEGSYSGDAAADLIHDRQTLGRLRGNSGSFARVAGSWKDF